MEPYTISVLWVFIGILVWPELTLCIILWQLGHPFLGIFALLASGGESVKTVVKERIIDSRTNQVISEREVGA